MDIKQDFRVYCSTNLKELKKSLIEDISEKEIEDDSLYIEGIASTTSIDEDGDFMTKSCLEDMKRQVIGLSILKEHGRTLDDILGRVVQVLDSNENSFKIKSKILPKFKYYLLDFLENDINLGYSIGAKAIDYEPNENSEYGWKINKVKLYEVSLVPLPANWDSFGSVKISKELDNNDDVIVAKCFNGACKELVKEYSNKVNDENISKEIEDNQKEGEKDPLTKKECINLINEASLEIYERLLSEILDETKKMIEKYHLDNNSNQNNNNESSETDKSNDKKNTDEDSSKKEEDEEKNKSMSEEINEKIEVEETPDVQKNLEEKVEGTSEVKEKEMSEKEVEKELDDETVTVHVSTETISNEDVLKSINEMKEMFMKKFDDELESKVNEKVEEIKKNLRGEIEEELFKDLTTERKPVETEQPKVEVEKEVKEEVVEKENKAMSAHDIAKMLTQ